MQRCKPQQHMNFLHIQIVVVIFLHEKIVVMILDLGKYKTNINQSCFSLTYVFSNEGR